MKHAQLLWLIGLGVAACLTCSPKASAQGQTVTDDGLYTLYTYVDTDGSNVYANSWFDEDLGGAASADEFTTLLAQAYWQLSDGSSSTSGSGESFSSAVSPGSSVVVTFNYIMYYSYFYVPEGPPGGGGLMCQGYAEYTCYGYAYPSVSAYIGIPSPPPLISSLDPSSVYQGDQGTLTITGSNFIENSGDQLQLNFLGGNNAFTLVSAPSICTSLCTATYSYDFSGYPTGTYSLYVSNNEADSEPKSFTVLPAWPVDPCAVGSSPKTQYSSFVFTGGSGSVIVTFSGAAYSTVSQTVFYGPYSTADSIAAHVAALITSNYTQYGLTARSFGPNIIYSGSSDIGTVNHVIAGSSLTTTVSSTAASAAKMACMVAPPTPAPACGTVNPLYLLGVTYDSVSWKDDGFNYGRNVNYVLEFLPTKPNTAGAPVTANATVTEHLSKRMAYGYTSHGLPNSGEFDDYLGSLGGDEIFITDRCFTVTSPTLGNLGHVMSYDLTGMKPQDHIHIQRSTKTTILNYSTNSDGTPKSVALKLR